MKGIKIILLLISGALCSAILAFLYRRCKAFLDLYIDGRIDKQMDCKLQKSRRDIERRFVDALYHIGIA